MKKAPVRGAGRRSDRGSAGRAPATFSRFVWLWNVVQDRQTPQLHREICQWLDESWHSNERRLLLLVFRDAGKSTLVALYCAWLLYMNPNCRILVLSAEHALATKMTRHVRAILERHPMTNDLLEPSPENWAADQITVRRESILRDPSLLARGISGNITGCRADVIICDDVEVPNTADTDEKRQSLRERLHEINFILVPEGLQLFVGTPHSHHSIYAENSRRESKETKPFLSSHKRLTLPLLTTQGEIRWPERFPPESITALLDGAGPAKFRSQMLLLPTRPEDVRLDPELLLVYDSAAVLVSTQGREMLRIGGRRMVSAVAAWDPAYGRPDRGDASVVAAVFADAEGHFWLHDIEYLEVESGDESATDEATQLCRAVAAFLSRNHLPSIRVETNGIGGFLPALLRRELHRSGVGASVIQHAERVPKDRRILDAFDPLLAARRLHVNRKILCTRFLEEMREWRPGRRGRDDGLDAVATCLLAEPFRLPLLRGRPAGPTWRRGGIFEVRADFAP